MNCPADIDRSLLIEGLGKGLRVIEAFSSGRASLTATEVGQLTSLTRTAARRYLVSLVHFGFAESDGKHYWLLPSVLRLGQTYLDSARLPRLARPLLKDLCERIGETCALSVLQQGEVHVLLQCNPSKRMAIGFPSGTRLPIRAASSGVAIASAYSQGDVEDWLSSRESCRREIFAHEAASDFVTAVDVARRRGYALVDTGIDPGLVELALPLRDRAGQCLGALSATFQTWLRPSSSLDASLVAPLRQCADLLGELV